MEVWRRRKRSFASSLNSEVQLLLGLSTLLLLARLVTSVQGSDSTTTVSSVEPEDYVDSEINQIDRFDDNEERWVMGKVVDAIVPITSLNETLGAGLADNSLWHGLLSECGRSTSLMCVKRNVFGYLDRSIGVIGDFAVTDSLVFKKNANQYENKYERSKNANESLISDKDKGNGTRGNKVKGDYEYDYDDNYEYDEDEYIDEKGNEVDPDEEGIDEPRSLDSFEGVTNILYDKGIRFVMNHDLQFQLPDTLGGALVRISPRALEQDGGALLKVEMNPAKTNAGEGRIFFKKHKEWKKKLLMSFFALLLVIKMIKVKLMYLLPLLIGVGTAKKLLLKMLLFLFPAFAHLFKFCSTYHASHTSKFHHHHHQIAHHHHHVPVRVPVPVPVPVHHSEHHSEHLGPYPPSNHGGWDSSGPEHEYLTNRNEHENAAEKELASWGLGHGAGDSQDTFSANYGDSFTNTDQAGAHSLAYNAYTYLDEQPPTKVTNVPKGIYQPVLTPSSIKQHLFVTPTPQTGLRQPQGAHYLPNSPLQTQKVYPIPQGNSLLFNQQQQFTQQPQVKSPTQQNLQIQLQNLEIQQQLEHQQKLQQRLQQQQQRLQQQQSLQQPQQQPWRRQTDQQPGIRLNVLTPKPPLEGSNKVTVTYDAFYSPILQKVDNVFVQLGFNEEACRERLICSMYKKPTRFSPHSNLVSAELSREPSELKRPAELNSAVTRFDKYVQAARDGQDQKDCLSLYPTCTVNTEI